MYRVDASGPKEAVPAVKAAGAEDQNVLHAFPAQLPVPAGAILGARLEYADPGNPLRPVYYLDAKFSFGCLGGACTPVPPTGGSAQAASYVGMVAMNASLEPDADHDGLGDESQDPCVGVCQPPAPPATAAPPSTGKSATKKKCKKGKKLKRGKCVKKKHRKKARRK